MDAAELAGVGVSGSAAEQVIRLAKLARASGIDGMVCSPEEVAALRADLGSEVMLVTPGIRAAGDAVGDQRRIATPESAIAMGASKLVVGRPITQANDPAAAALAILEQIQRGAAR
jgi:orotidine-5'-phosphate decarboxylase